MYKMTKKEIKLNLMYGKKWDVIIKYKITISDHDTENILKCNEKMIDLNTTLLKRETWKFRLFGRYIYFNKLYGGLNG